MGNITSTSEIDFLTKIHNEKYLRNRKENQVFRHVSFVPLSSKYPKRKTR